MGGSLAYVGFTGSTNGNSNTTQSFSNFRFTAIPTPSSAGLFALAAPRLRAGVGEWLSSCQHARPAFTRGAGIYISEVSPHSGDYFWKSVCIHCSFLGQRIIGTPKWTDAAWMSGQVRRLTHKSCY